MKLADFILKKITIENEKNTAVITENGNAYTYNQIKELTVSLVNALLAEGVCPKERVLIIADHDLDSILFLAAISALNAQALMPYNLQEASIEEWKNLILTANPEHIFFIKNDQSTLESLSKISDKIKRLRLSELRINNNINNLRKLSKKPIKNFLILFTSGTTGNPKAISISEELVCFRIRKVSAKLKFEKGSRIFMSGLINNTTGIIFSYGSFFKKAVLFIPTLRIYSNWPVLIDKFKITHIMLRPLALKNFIDGKVTHHSNLTSLKIIAYGAAAVSLQLLETARKMITCEWIQGYGLSETFGPFCWLTEREHRKNKHLENFYCVGKPDNSLKISIQKIQDKILSANIGELIISGKFMMNGYYSEFSKEPISVAEHFNTGDLAEVSENGYIFLKGRLSDSILTKNGHRIYPEEIEAQVKEIHGVREAKLVSISRNCEEVPVICISGDIVYNDEEKILGYILERFINRVSKEKWPEYIYISNLPFIKNQNEKIIKAELVKSAEKSKLIHIV